MTENRSQANPLTLELRIPISPTDNDMRSVRYLLESIQEFSGPISRAAHCVLSVGARSPAGCRRNIAGLQITQLSFTGSIATNFACGNTTLPRVCSVVG